MIVCFIIKPKGEGVFGCLGKTIDYLNGSPVCHLLIADIQSLILIQCSLIKHLHTTQEGFRRGNTLINIEGGTDQLHTIR